MMLEKLFGLSRNHTTVRTEIIAGLTTFLAMSYILAANPNILSGTGMDASSIFVATCVAAIVGTLVMAFVANWPVGMAPGMGLNVYFASVVVLQMGFTWQQALGAVFISGIIFLFLTATGVRKWLLDGVPQSLRSAITAGIGLFLAIVALKSSGIITDSPATMVTLGDLKTVGPILTMVGLMIIVVLDAYKVRGAILIGILAVTVISFILGVNEFKGVVAMPPSIAPTFLQLDIMGAFSKGIFQVLLAFVLVEIFDATGSLIGVGKRAGLITPGNDGTLDKALFADSTAIVAGSLIGTSSTTAYVESAAGAVAGGRTGLTALTVAVFFGLSLFFSPLILSVPAYATAPALIFVACLMMREFAEIKWDNLTDAVPAALTAMMMPFTYSISEGLAFGFISYAVLKTLTGHFREVCPATWGIAILFVIHFIIK